MIAEFSKNLKLIKCFTSSAVADDEWKEMEEKIGKILKGTGRDRITVNDFSRYELYQWIDEIEAITMRAEKREAMGYKIWQEAIENQKHNKIR